VEKTKRYCITLLPQYFPAIPLSEIFTFQEKPDTPPCPKRRNKIIYLASSSQKVVSSDIQGFEGSGGTRKGSYSKYCSV